MIIIPNQPIHFKYCSNCNCQGKECASNNQIAEFTDQFSFQVEDSELFLGAELLLNVGNYIGDFEDGTAINSGNWSDGGAPNDWVINNVAPLDGTYDVKMANNNASVILFNTNVITGIAVGDWFKVSFLHSAIVSPRTLKVYVYIGGAPVLFDTLAAGTAAGTYTKTAQATGIIQGIGFEYTGAEETDFFLDNVSIRKYDLSKFKIYDCCVDNSLIGVLDSAQFLVTDENITFEDFWSNYITSLGIYKVCIDDVDLIKNGTFLTNLDDWTQTATGNTWAHSAALLNAEVQLADNETSKELYQVVDLPAKCEFILYFTAVVSLGDGITLGLYVNHILYQSYSFLDSTTLTESLLITSKNKPITSIGFIFSNTNDAGNNGWIDDVSMIADLCSDCIEIGETMDCSLYLEATQTNDSFGFDFADLTFHQRFFADNFKHNPEYNSKQVKSSYGIEYRKKHKEFYKEYQRNYQRLRYGHKSRIKRQININEWFNNVCKEIENGLTIQKACKKLNYSRWIFYENITTEQKLELRSLKTIFVNKTSNKRYITNKYSDYSLPV